MFAAHEIMVVIKHGKYFQSVTALTIVMWDIAGCLKLGLILMVHIFDNIGVIGRHTYYSGSYLRWTISSRGNITYTEQSISASPWH